MDTWQEVLELLQSLVLSAFIGTSLPSVLRHWRGLGADWRNRVTLNKD